MKPGQTSKTTGFIGFTSYNKGDLVSMGFSGYQPGPPYYKSKTNKTIKTFGFESLARFCQVLLVTNLPWTFADACNILQNDLKLHTTLEKNLSHYAVQKKEGVRWKKLERGC